MKQAVNIVIRNQEGELLLQMRDNTKGICNPLKWNFFGGGVKEGEEPEAAGLRELKEELGIEAAPDQVSFAGTFEKGDKQTHLIVYDIPVDWDDVHVYEGAGAGFFDKETALKIDATEETHDMIKEMA